MSTTITCDYPECKQQAMVRVTTTSLVDQIGMGVGVTLLSKDACKDHALIQVGIFSFLWLDSMQVLSPEVGESEGEDARA